MSCWRLCATSGFGDEIFSAEGSQERECLVNAFVQHPALGMKSCLQRVRKSVNVLLTKPCLQRPRKSVIFSAEGSQERGCLVSAFAQPQVVAE